MRLLVIGAMPALILSAVSARSSMADVAQACPVDIAKGAYLQCNTNTARVVLLPFANANDFNQPNSAAQVGGVFIFQELPLPKSVTYNGLKDLAKPY